MSFTEKLAQSRSGGKNIPFAEKDFDEIEEFHASPFFGAENLRNSPSCIDLRLSNGASKAIPYSYIHEIDFEPSEGIIITTSTKLIKITGRNLRMLYNYLSAYRVRFIKANIGNDLTNEQEVFVKDIKIQEV